MAIQKGIDHPAVRLYQQVSISRQQELVSISQLHEQNYVNIVTDILAKTGNIGIKNKEGNTALILAAEKGHTEVVSIIMEHLQGCSADIREVIVEQDVSKTLCSN